MLDALSILPFAFWVTIAVLAMGVIQAIRRAGDGSGFPMLTVLATITAWYVGDAFYNDYANYHARIFESGILESAWWEVAWFVVVFILLVPGVHRWFNARDLRRRSGVLQLFKYGVNQPELQKQLNLLFIGCASIWLILAVVATLRLKGEVLYYFFPFLGYKAEPWGRNRIGSGFDALLSVAYYFQLLACGIFGMVAALSTRPQTRTRAIIFCLLSWSYFIFDRTRNSMLAVVMPGVLSYGLLRVRGGILKKGLVLGCCFVVINAWMGFVIANRSEMSITDALKQKGFSLSSSGKVHHEGLNMYEELCWINKFMEEGTLSPDWGGNYFAEAVNMIPRAIWHGKPLIGIDYAIARGQGGGDADSAGVYATISTGLIGQGVVNFGRILGPAAAALLMSFWVAILARLDLHMDELGRLPLYATGLFTTFNEGRDISLLAMYPFVFGSLAIWWLERNRPKVRSQQREVIGPQQSAAIPIGAPGGLVAGKRLRGGGRRRAKRRISFVK